MTFHVKKIISLVAASTLALSLAACGASEADNGTSTSEEKATTAGNVSVKLGVVGAVYEELWAPAKETLAGEGIDLEFVQFSDYTTPNNALDSGDIDLNAFQHVAYFDTDVEANGYDLSTIGYTFIIPLNLYSEKISSVEELKDGDTIAYPNDPTNGGRALKVLEAAGVIKLKADAGFSPTVDDIESYVTDVKLEPIAANNIQSVLPDVTAGFVNGNYALSAGLDPEKAAYRDQQLDAENYWNVIAARSEDLADADKKATYEKVVKAFQSEATQAEFDGQFKGYFIPVGWDQNLLK